jgi:2-dehydro-3-deoxygalactonokinase
MIGVDWGTTSFRAFRIARDGTIRDRRAGLRGIVNVPDNRFADSPPARTTCCCPA